MKRLIIFALTLSMTFFLAACGNGSDNAADKEKDKVDDKTTEQTDTQEVEVSEDEKVAEDEVVVKINDSEITGEEYNLIYLQAKMHIKQTGQDVDDQEIIKTLAIESLVEQELLKQAAAKAGIEVSADEVQGEFDRIKSENEEQLSAFLEQYHLTEKTYKDRLSFALVHEKYLATEISVPEISDEEIEEVYNGLKEKDKDIPELKDVKDQLKAELTMRKEQEELQLKIKKLREDAKIETLI